MLQPPSRASLMSVSSELLAWLRSSCSSCTPHTMRTRGLQTRCATPLVEKLEMYDSFHASEDPGNRQTFF